jgi:hypothetical protein
MGKRGNGEGGITRHKKSGLYMARYTVQTATGPKRKTVYGKTRKEAAEKLTKARFAIRAQQAEKDLKMAEYYERTGHPGSAVFYYELVRRRYAGTKYSDLATDRKDRLVKLMQEGRPDPGNDPLAIAQAKWKEVFGVPKSVEEKDRARVDPNLMQAGGP